jgi:urea carboxylase
MFRKVLVANRGEIACRIFRTLRAIGAKAVAVYSDADVHAMHVAQADEAIRIGPAAARDSYLNQQAILDAAKQSGAEAIHPGYGFLSENPDFADACEAAGIVFLGPTGDQMRSFGLKHAAREHAKAAGVPLLPGSKLLPTVEEALQAAEQIGYPVMLKSTAGGGGIGLRICRDAESLAESFRAVEHLGKANFGNAGMFLEKFVESARHVEVQLFGDGQGRVLTLWERDCSTQRRNQKVIEETPAPHLPPELRLALRNAAADLAARVNYRSAGTVEFIVDAATNAFYFLEVNTRLQVEHGVTEAVYGIDLVEWMLRLGAGEMAPLDSMVVEPSGHAIQVRIYAEDPGKQFQPSSGTITEARFPEGVRCDTWIENGAQVSPHYDPLLAKLIVHGERRGEALTKLQAALAETEIAGIEGNLDYLRQVIASPAFQAGRVTTGFLQQFVFAPKTINVLDGGTMTTVQDYPGRLGYWNVGVPPSGPFDSLALRLANAIVGNAPEAAGLEITLSGPMLEFNRPAVVALCGADMAATLDHQPLPMWQAVEVSAGSILRIGSARGAGMRSYLAVAGGLDVPQYLGSRSTFTLGEFGGHAGRALRAGDVLRIDTATPAGPARDVDPALVPAYSATWELHVLYGPHGAPDFFTQQDIDTFFSHQWEVHYNSNRTGVRLIGPKPKWARRDGGEAGLHPSNIHDNAYAVGTVDFTGDMPILLGPDGPSLGGFVCPATVIHADLWKLGQLKPGDKVRFVRVSVQEAAALEAAQDEAIRTLSAATIAAPAITGQAAPEEPVLARIAGTSTTPEVVYRLDGDRYLLVEYGPLVLDLNLRFRVHALMQWCQQHLPAGVIDLTPGIRSLHLHYDNRLLPLSQLLALLKSAEAELPPVDEVEVPTRILHLPLSWDDAATRLAIEKYMSGVRKDAPWCPSNIEFIRRINGLNSVEDVYRTVFDASYLVLGLGDVYLGAPVATPLDPRHRLVTTKYNPARTWTPQNAVGIGGAYLCIYGMEGPGGYQFVGRTLQVWNTYRSTPDFEPGKPWLLRFFDQIRFYPVSHKELLSLREDFPHGKHKLRVEEQTFRLKDYNEFLRREADSIQAFKKVQQQSFEEERERWAAAGQLTVEEPELPPAPEFAISANGNAVRATVPGSIWKLLVTPGDRIEEGQRVAILESMKMEIPITSPVGGTVVEVACGEGSAVSSGQVVCVVES